MFIAALFLPNTEDSKKGVDKNKDFILFWPYFHQYYKIILLSFSATFAKNLTVC